MQAQSTYQFSILNIQINFSNFLSPKMKVAVTLLAVFACAHAGGLLPTTYISRAPAFDSAVIKSDRFGGNFAYSVAEHHAYAAHTPIVQHVAAPVAYAAAPAAVTYAAPAVTTYAAQPALYNSPLGYGLPYAYAAPTAAVAKYL